MLLNFSERKFLVFLRQWMKGEKVEQTPPPRQVPPEQALPGTDASSYKHPIPCRTGRQLL